MTQTLDLNKMGLASMNQFESTETSGGGWFDGLMDSPLGRIVALVGVAQAIYDFGKGLNDGMNAQ